MKLKPVIRNKILVPSGISAPQNTENDTRELLNIGSCTFDDLVRESNLIDEKCSDYVVEGVNYSNFHLDTAGRICFKGFDDTDEYKYLMPTRFAMSQLCAKIGVPIRYYEKCMQTGRVDLARDNIHSWLKTFNKDLLIREYNGGARGILSSKYSICDTSTVLDVVSSVININDYKIKGYFLSPERFHLRLIQRDMMKVDGEDLFAGFTIDSSDVGRNVLNCNFLIYKQVCTNGLVVSKGDSTLFSQKHIGITTDEFKGRLVASFNNINILVDNAEQLIKRAKTQFNHWNINSYYEDEIMEFVNYIRQKTNLSEDSSRKVINLMQTKYEDNRWGLINGITEVAQDFTLERRLELERIAGNILVA